MSESTPAISAQDQYNAIVTARDRFQFQGMAAVLFLLGVVLTFGQLWGMVQLIRSTSWPTVAGRVVQSEVRTTGGRRPSRYAMIAYTYAVRGKAYKSKRVSFGGFFGFSPAHEDLAEKYHRGTNVRVAYNPARPATAVLDHHVDPFGAGALMAGVVFIVAGAVLLSYLRAAKNLNVSGMGGEGFPPMMEEPAYAPSLLDSPQTTFTDASLTYRVTEPGAR